MVEEIARFQLSLYNPLLPRRNKGSNLSSIIQDHFIPL